MKKEGYLIQRPDRGKWVYKYTDADHKHRRRNIAPLTVKRDAALLLVGKLNLDVASIGGPSVTFNSLLNFYFRTKRFTKPSTKTTEIQILEACREKYGTHTAVTISPVAIKSWLNTLRHPKTGKPLSEITKAKYRTTMGGIYRHAQRENFLPPGEVYRPCDLVSFTAVSSFESIVLTPKQTAAVLSHLKSPEREMLLLASATGLRASEVLGLKWQDIDFRNGELEVRQTYVHGEIQNGAKTKASLSVVMLPEPMVKDLLAWRQQSTCTEDGDYIFPSSNFSGSQPRSPSAVVEKYIQPACVRAGVVVERSGKFFTNDGKNKQITRLGFHVFRHSFATALAQAGASQKTIQDTMRHAQFKMSAQYIKTSTATKKDATTFVFGEILGYQSGHQN